MVAASPSPAPARGAIESVVSPLLGLDPHAPVESPASWVMLAAARRQFGAARAATAAAATVSTSGTPAPAPAATNAPPLISGVTLGAPNATTGVVTGAVAASDSNGDALTYKATTSTKGSVGITATGVFTYTPNPTARHAAAKVGATTAVQTDTVTVTVTDSKGAAVTKSVTVPVTALNAAPSVTAAIGKPDPITGVASGKATASDSDKDALTYAASKPANGTVVVKSDGTFTYTPTASARTAARASSAPKTDTFNVTVSDGYGGSKSVSVTATIAPSNAAPVAGTPTSTTNSSTGVVTGAVNATDPDKDPLTYTAATTTTAKGSVSVTATGAFTYTPTAAARHTAAKTAALAADKSDTFAVKITDKYGAVSSIPVRVAISPANTAPAVTASIGKPDPVTGVAAGKVTASDADKDSLSYTASKPANGTAAIKADGSFTYTPTAFARATARSSATPKTDTFTINVTDGYGGSKAVSVTATIAPSNSAPVAGSPYGMDDPATGVVTGNVNAIDPDYDPLTYTAGTFTTAKGAYIVTSAGTITYTPTAAARHAAAKTGATTADKYDVVTVTVTDKYGAATVLPLNIELTTSNAAPVPGTTTAGAPNATTGTVAGSVTATDADKDALTYSGSATTAKGKTTVSADGTFTYTPTAAARHAAAYTAAAASDLTDQFTVTAVDGYGGSRAIPVTVRIGPANKAPVASVVSIGSADPATGAVTGTVTISDADGDSVNYSLPTSTTKGSVAFSPDGTFTYTPTAAARNVAAGANATAADKTDSFTITFTDEYGGKSDLPISVPVSPKSSVPVTASLKGYIQNTPEGNSGTTYVPVTVKLSAPSTQPVTVYYRVAESILNTAATPWSDYAPDESSVVVSPGQTEATFNVRVYGDTQYEADERVIVQLTDASGATLDAQGLTTSGFNILNDDPVPGVTASLKGYIQNTPEGNSGTTYVPVTVKLSAPSTQPVTVYYRVAESILNTAATPWSDYAPDESSVVVSPGQTEATFNVRVYGDTQYEADERVIVQLTGASGATLDAQGLTTSGFNIINDDAPRASAAVSVTSLLADNRIRLFR